VVKKDMDPTSKAAKRNEQCTGKKYIRGEGVSNSIPNTISHGP